MGKAEADLLNQTGVILRSPTADFSAVELKKYLELCPDLGQPFDWFNLLYADIVDGGSGFFDADDEETPSAMSVFFENKNSQPALIKEYWVYNDQLFETVHEQDADDFDPQFLFALIQCLKEADKTGASRQHFRTASRTVVDLDISQFLPAYEGLERTLLRYQNQNIFHQPVLEKMLADIDKERNRLADPCEWYQGIDYKSRDLFPQANKTQTETLAAVRIHCEQNLFDAQYHTVVKRAFADFISARSIEIICEADKQGEEPFSEQGFQKVGKQIADMSCQQNKVLNRLMLGYLFEAYAMEKPEKWTKTAESFRKDYLRCYLFEGGQLTETVKDTWVC
jgi:hypothetical protein